MKIIVASLCTIVLFTWASLSATAQKNVATQHLLWTGYFLKLKLNDTYQLRQELDERNFLFSWRQHQFVSRTFMERKLGKGWSTGIGFTYLVQSLPQDPDVISYTNRKELRPQLEIVYKQSISEKFTIHHRYWSEFRFFEQADKSFVYGNNRFRYRLEARWTPAKKITLKVFDEMMLNLGKRITQNIFDQNRYGASIQYMPLQNFGIELGYINLFQQRKSGVDFYHLHIARFAVHHTISCKKIRS
jgi:hypothetical protein